MPRGNPAQRLFLLSSGLAFVKTGFVADATSIKMDYLPIGHARVDPILSHDCVSDHVHTFYGPQSGVDPRRTESSDNIELHSRLVATQPSENTGNVEENKSMYWHPTVYKRQPSSSSSNGGNNNEDASAVYTRDTMAQSSAYYVWETGQTTAFPNGFKMIGGLDRAESHALAECVGESPCDDGDCHTENDFFPATKCEELEVSMTMPSCWDGINIDKPPDHTSHVAYAEGSDFDGACPASHPVKIPQIRLFFRIAPYDGGWHTFSDGTGVFHADYVSGWDEGFLQNLLDDCRNEGAGAMPNHFCNDVLTYKDGPKCSDESTCDFGDPGLVEKIRAFQPSPPLDVRGTIVAEETEVVTGALPRGTCNGSLVGSGNNNNDAVSSSPTDAPVVEPVTESPVASPTSDEDEDEENENEDENENDNEEENENEYEENENEDENKDENEDEDENENEDEENENENENENEDEENENEDENENENQNEDEENENEDESVCEDSLEFLFRGKSGKNCEWIKKRKTKFCKKISFGTKVSVSCPVTCGTCPGDCQDDSTFRFKGKQNKNCKWVKRKAKKNSRICNRNSNSTKVKVACPVACNACSQKEMILS